MRLSLVFLFLGMLSAPMGAAAQARPPAASAAEQEIQNAILRGENDLAAKLATARLRGAPAAGAAAARLRVLLARAELGQGNIQTAFAELRRALAADPKSLDALYYLATVAEALAPQTYERLYAIAPNSDRVHQLLAEAALAQENHAEAEAEFRAALQANPRSLDALLGLADLKRSQSAFDEALSLYQSAVAIRGLNHDLAYGIGACYAYRQEHDLAIDYFRKAVTLSPDAAVSHFALGNSLFQSGRLAEAIGPLNRAVALNPKIKQAWFLLGRAHQRAGHADLARAAFKRVDELTREELEKEQSPRKKK